LPQKKLSFLKKNRDGCGDIIERKGFLYKWGVREKKEEIIQKNGHKTKREEKA
jgi:hypothetical protein